MVAQYGFKSVNADNVLSVDPAIASLCTLSPLGVVRPMLPDDFIHPVVSINLDDDVPLEVRRAFICARDGIGYAYWYYPMLTLMTQQILRVGDFAANAACALHRMPRPPKGFVSFAARIEWLLSKHLIPSADRNLWDGILDLRNTSTHPDFQQLWPVGMAIPIVQRVAGAINGIDWSSQPVSDPRP